MLTARKLQGRPFRQPERQPRERRTPTVSDAFRLPQEVVAAAPVPKTEPYRDPHLLSMARGQSCLLQVPGVCNHDRETVVAAHSNWAMHGKAKSRKADDCYHVHACSACHAWLDQGPAPAAEKKSAFMRAHLWMVEIWRQLVAGFLDGTPKDRKSAQAALDRLNATPVGGLEP